MQAIHFYMFLLKLSYKCFANLISFDSVTWNYLGMWFVESKLMGCLTMILWMISSYAYYIVIDFLFYSMWSVTIIWEKSFKIIFCHFHPVVLKDLPPLSEGLFFFSFKSIDWKSLKLISWRKPMGKTLTYSSLSQIKDISWNVWDSHLKNNIPMYC